MSLGRSRAVVTLVSVAALWFIAAISPSSAGPSDPIQIVIKDFTFTPSSLPVKAGSTVTWANKDDEPHSMVSDTGLFHSGAVDTNETYSFKFDKPGTYPYHCAFHPRMIATIIVQ